jgi:hypothetical protein
VLNTPLPRLAPRPLGLESKREHDGGEPFLGQGVGSAPKREPACVFPNPSS